MGNSITLKCRDGVSIGAYAAEPASPAKAGLVVLQEIFGVNHHIRNVCDWYAAVGYSTVAPALFDRVKPGAELGYVGPDVEEGRSLRGATNLDAVLLDVQAAIGVLKASGRKVGVVGYCWGGSLAFLSACRLQGLSAAVGYYGGQIIPHIAETPKAPVMLHFGERDKGIPLSDVETIKARLPGLPIHLYPADHGFNCDERASYDEVSSKLALSRTLSFFEQYLG